MFPHDPEAFTQGLAWAGGSLYESTGLYGASSLRRVDLETGAVLERHDLGEHLFGEGLTVRGEALFLLTWREGTAFVHDRRTLRPRHIFRYRGEGWGLTHDGRRLIMSDGSATLRLRDPETFRLEATLMVHDDGAPVRGLNELEFIRGEIWANVWKSDRIARIDPGTGRVRAWLDLAPLRGVAEQQGPVDVLNGIAWDETGDRVFVTGKRWPVLFEIRVALPAGPAQPGPSSSSRVSQ